MGGRPLIPVWLRAWEPSERFVFLCIGAYAVSAVTAWCLLAAAVALAVL